MIGQDKEIQRFRGWTTANEVAFLTVSICGVVLLVVAIFAWFVVLPTVGLLYIIGYLT